MKSLSVLPLQYLEILASFIPQFWPFSGLKFQKSSAGNRLLNFDPKLQNLRFNCILGHFFLKNGLFFQNEIKYFKMSRPSLQLDFGRLYKIRPLFCKIIDFSGLFYGKLYKFRAFYKKFWPEVEALNMQYCRNVK